MGSGETCSTMANKRVQRSDKQEKEALEENRGIARREERTYMVEGGQYASSHMSTLIGSRIMTSSDWGTKKKTESPPLKEGMMLN